MFFGPTGNELKRHKSDMRPTFMLPFRMFWIGHTLSGRKAKVKELNAKVYYGTRYYKGVDERQMGYKEANMRLAMAEFSVTN